MATLVGIDGTDDSFFNGEKRENYYKQLFTNSFVNRICQAGGGKYYPGPLVHGGNLTGTIDKAVDHITKRNSGKILLTGYSRGAAGVVVVAQRLLELGISVEAMMLFDCVARHITLPNTSEIPVNVKNVLHVIRNPASNSRKSFGNSGMSAQDPNRTNYPPPWEHMYMCTHGGMGGCYYVADPSKPAKRYQVPYIDRFVNPIVDPYATDLPQGPNDLIWEVGGVPFQGGTWINDGWTSITFAQDRIVSDKIWVDVKPFLIQHGFLV